MSLCPVVAFRVVFTLILVGVFVEVLFWWWDGKVGWGCWLLSPDWPVSPTNQSLIPLEGMGQANGGVQTVPVDSALWEGWLSHHNTHF